MPYRYEMGIKARIITTGDYGQIIGRTEFSNGRQNGYLIEFEKDGELEQEWTNEANVESFDEM